MTLVHLGGIPFFDHFFDPILVQFLGGWSVLGSKVAPKQVQNWFNNSSIFELFFVHVFCNFGSALELKSSEKRAKLALEGGPGEVTRGQEAFLRTCIWTQYLLCFCNIRHSSRRAQVASGTSRRFQERPEASRKLQERPGASRSVQECPGASRSF